MAAVSGHMQRRQVVQRDVVNVGVVLEQKPHTIQVVPLGGHMDGRQAVLQDGSTQSDLYPNSAALRLCVMIHMIHVLPLWSDKLLDCQAFAFLCEKPVSRVSVRIQLDPFYFTLLPTRQSLPACGMNS